MRVGVRRLVVGRVRGSAGSRRRRRSHAASSEHEHRQLLAALSARAARRARPARPRPAARRSRRRARSAAAAPSRSAGTTRPGRARSRRDVPAAPETQSSANSGRTNSSNVARSQLATVAGVTARTVAVRGDVHRQRDLAEVVARPQHAPLAARRPASPTSMPAEHDVEAVAALALEHDRPARPARTRAPSAPRASRASRPGSTPSRPTRWSSCAVADEAQASSPSWSGSRRLLAARRPGRRGPGTRMASSSRCRPVGLLLLLLGRLRLLGVHRVPLGRVGLFCRPWASSTAGGTARAAAPTSSARTARPSARTATASTRARSRPRARSASTATGRRPAGARAPARRSRATGISPAASSRRASIRSTRSGASSREETGLTSSRSDFVGVWMDTYGEDEGAASTLNLYWTARVTGGEPEPADDVSELRWFAPDELRPASSPSTSRR